MTASKFIELSLICLDSSFPSAPLSVTATSSTFTDYFTTITGSSVFLSFILRSSPDSDCAIAIFSHQPSGRALLHQLVYSECPFFQKSGAECPYAGFMGSGSLNTLFYCNSSKYNPNPALPIAHFHQISSSSKVIVLQSALRDALPCFPDVGKSQRLASARSFSVHFARGNLVFLPQSTISFQSKSLKL
eukprot:GFKZ01013515.1.p1 GENE.GFKZ01013515.1~~GFKZ01013515.1.p1  ORF type:complete len:189 (-),score=3.86 GFKZ01013515.1:651-1217(-)